MKPYQFKRQQSQLRNNHTSPNIDNTRFTENRAVNPVQNVFPYPSNNYNPSPVPVNTSGTIYYDNFSAHYNNQDSYSSNHYRFPLDHNSNVDSRFPFAVNLSTNYQSPPTQNCNGNYPFPLAHASNQNYQFQLVQNSTYPTVHNALEHPSNISASQGGYRTGSNYSPSFAGFATGSDFHAAQNGFPTTSNYPTSDNQFSTESNYPTSHSPFSTESNYPASHSPFSTEYTNHAPNGFQMKDSRSNYSAPQNGFWTESSYAASYSGFSTESNYPASHSEFSTESKFPASMGLPRKSKCPVSNSEFSAESSSPTCHFGFSTACRYPASHFGFSTESSYPTCQFGFPTESIYPASHFGFSTDSESDYYDPHTEFSTGSDYPANMNQQMVGSKPGDWEIFGTDPDPKPLAHPSVKEKPNQRHIKLQLSNEDFQSAIASDMKMFLDKKKESQIQTNNLHSPFGIGLQFNSYAEKIFSDNPNPAVIGSSPEVIEDYRTQDITNETWRSMYPPPDDDDAVSLDDPTSYASYRERLRNLATNERSSVMSMNTPVNLNQNDCEMFNFPKTKARKRRGIFTLSTQLKNTSNVILTKDKTYCLPGMINLDAKADDLGQCFVEMFEVGHLDYGKIVFQNVINVASANLDWIVIFEHKRVILYSNRFMVPQSGTEFNRPAIVTLFNYWPDEPAEKALAQRDPESLAKYKDSLVDQCILLGHDFVSFNRDNGEFTFKVTSWIKKKKQFL